MSTAGRTDYPSYHTPPGLDLSVDEEQWIADRADELAGDAFDQQAPGVRDWLLDYAVGDDLHPIGNFVLVAMFASSADAALAKERVRDLYIDEHHVDYWERACADWREVFEDDPDCAADFDDAT